MISNSIPGINQIPLNDYIQDDAIQALSEQRKQIPNELLAEIANCKSPNKIISLFKTKKAFQTFSNQNVNVKRANIKFQVGPMLRDHYLQFSEASICQLRDSIDLELSDEFGVKNKRNVRSSDNNLNSGSDTENSINLVTDPIPNVPLSIESSNTSGNLGSASNSMTNLFTNLQSYRLEQDIPLQRTSIHKLEQIPLLKLLPKPGFSDLVSNPEQWNLKSNLGRNPSGESDKSHGSNSHTDSKNVTSYYDHQLQKTSYSNANNNTLLLTIENLYINNINQNHKISCSLSLWDISSKTRLSEEIYFNGRNSVTAALPIVSYSENLFFIIRVSSQFLPASIGNLPELISVHSKSYDAKYNIFQEIIKKHNLKLKSPFAWGAIPFYAVMKIQEKIKILPDNNTLSNLIDDNAASEIFDSPDLSPGNSSASILRSESQTNQIKDNSFTPNDFSENSSSQTSLTANSLKTNANRALIRSTSFRSSIKSSFSQKSSLHQISTADYISNNQKISTPTTSSSDFSTSSTQNKNLNNQNQILGQTQIQKFFNTLKKSPISFKVHNIYKYENISKSCNTQILKYCYEFLKQTENLVIPEKLKKLKIECRIDLKFSAVDYELMHIERPMDGFGGGWSNDLDMSKLVITTPVLFGWETISLFYFVPH